MPCFKGLAVSIHTPNGPLTEYSVQKTSRLSRISTYIPVPPAQIPADSLTGKPEQSTFAISITLLTPGQEVPYSVPKPTADQPNPKGKIVGQLPGTTSDRGSHSGASIGPYVPLTTSPNETIAAYIYFDGRAKEEVATLLRKGEETWVNSRWVSVPEKEGGGLAEREFLFREVGLERWLNGLDLDGKDAAATIERRRQKLEKRRRKRKQSAAAAASDDDDDHDANGDSKTPRRKSTLRYGDDGELQDVSDDDQQSYSDTSTSDDDDDPIPEAAGQIKVALFRVLASGEIKRGEYSPQFDAHDDDEDSDNKESSPSGEGKNRADVDHTTSFAKPKTLDPKTISTQTVTGIDPTDKPYAVFTFLYRGERQLQKMGILPTPKSEKPSTAAKRRSIATEIPKLGPLKKEGTIGFSNFRDRRLSSKKGKPSGSDDEMDDSEDGSDDGMGIIGKMDDINETDVKREPGMLSPEDAESRGVAEGIRKMKLKRQHSAEPLNGSADGMRKSSKGGSGSPSAASTPKGGQDDGLAASPTNHGPGMSISGATADGGGKKEDEDFMVGSPLKKQRASMADFDNDIKRRLGAGLAGTASTIGQVLGTSAPSAEPSTMTTTPTTAPSGLQFGGILGNNNQDDNDDEL